MHNLQASGNPRLTSINGVPSATPPLQLPQSQPQSPLSRMGKRCWDWSPMSLAPVSPSANSPPHHHHHSSHHHPYSHSYAYAHPAPHSYWTFYSSPFSASAVKTGKCSMLIDANSCCVSRASPAEDYFE